MTRIIPHFTRLEKITLVVMLVIVACIVTLILSGVTTTTLFYIGDPL